MTVHYAAFRPKRARRVSAITGKQTALTEETELQIACFVRYTKQARMDKRLRMETRLFAINPVPQKTMAQAVLSKRMGLKSGVFDAVFHDMRTGYFVEKWIDFKANAGRLTDEQQDWSAWLADTPIQAHECRSVAEFERIVGI